MRRKYILPFCLVSLFPIATSAQNEAVLSQDKVIASNPPVWDYSGEVGPANWASLNPEAYKACEGSQQSPVDIISPRARVSDDLKPLALSYKNAPFFTVFDNWRQIQFTPSVGNTLRFKGETYALRAIRFYVPSEGSVDGKRGEMGIHFLHSTETDKRAVIAVKVVAGAENETAAAILKNLPGSHGAQRTVNGPLTPSSLLPNDLTSYYSYIGSITTPPCSEKVEWIILKEPVTFSQAQIDLFKKRYDSNVRPLQPLNGRPIYTTP